MTTIIIKSKTMTGWVLQFDNEEVEKIASYCEQNDILIDFSFFGGPAEEELIGEILGDETFDIFESSNWDYSLGDVRPIFDLDEIFEIFIESNGDNKEIAIDDIQIENNDYRLEDWIKSTKKSKSISFSYGYISDDIIDSEYIFDDINDINLSNIKIQIARNDFFGTYYVDKIFYGNKEAEYEDPEDPTGEYYDSLFFDNNRHPDEMDYFSHRSEKTIEKKKINNSKNTKFTNSKSKRLYKLTEVYWDDVKIEEVKELIHSGADPNFVLNPTDPWEGCTSVLQNLSRRGQNLEIIRSLVDEGADPLFVNANGDTALKIALRHGELEIGKFLIEKGADIKGVLEDCLSDIRLVSIDEYKNVLIDIVILLKENGENDMKKALKIYKDTGGNDQRIIELLK